MTDEQNEQHEAAEYIKGILNDEPEKLNSYHTKYEDFLFNIACRYNLVDYVNILLDNNDVFIDTPNRDKKTPLHIALYDKELPFVIYDNELELTPKIELIKILLESNRIDVNKTDKYGDSAFTFLCMYAQKDIDIQALRLFLECPRVNVQICDTDIPIIIACKYGRLNVVKILLEYEQIDPNIQDRTGETAFMEACMSRYDNTGEIVKLMLTDERIDVNILNKRGESAIAILGKYILKGHSEPKHEKKFEILMSNDRINKHDCLESIFELYREQTNYFVKLFGVDEVLKALKLH